MSSTTEPRVLGFNRNVFFLGIVSFLQDVSSEMIFTILPLFLTNVLRVGVPVVGLVEGVAESSSSLLKIVSGWLSDRLGRRKALVVLGYGLSTVAKPFMYLVSAWGAVLAVRLVDRTGKGIRTSPRDALLADSIQPEERGKSFGFHRGMDTLGAVVGLGVAALVIYLVQQGALELSRNAYRTMVLVGIVPAVLAVLLLLLFVKERRREVSPERAAPRQPTATAREGAGFDVRFKLFLAVMVVFTLGNSSDAFLILRAQNLGFSILEVFLLLITFNLVYALTALPAGVISDRLGRKVVIIIGWSVYALAYLGFALAAVAWQVWLLFALYGLYYGMVEGVARAFVADLVAAERRGIAYGLYHSAVGLSLLPASLIAGWLWHLVGPGAPFFLGAALAAVAAASLWVLVRQPSSIQPY